MNAIFSRKNYLYFICFFMFFFILCASVRTWNLRKNNDGQDFLKKTCAYKQIAGHEILADVFLPKKERIRPVVMYIHGGFMFANRTGLRQPLRDKLIEADYAVVSIDFRLAPETKLEEMIKDVQDAVIWIRKKGPELFNIDPQRVAITGGSAGGYLSLVSGFCVEPRPQALVVISGIGDFELYLENMNLDKSSLIKGEGPYAVVGDKPISDGGYEKRMDLWLYLEENGWYLSELLGFNPKMEPERYANLILFNNIPEDFPPTLIVHAKKDELVPFSHALKIQKALMEKGIENDLFVVPEGHSSQVIRGYPEASDKIVAFLDKYLK
jgi:acetyl esterase/lipase